MDSEDFARKIGDAFDKFLQEHGMTRNSAAQRMEMGRGTVNTYCHDNTKGKRVLASAEFLVKACLLGFVFEHDGRKIGALEQPLTNGNGYRPPGEQLSLPFSQTFELPNDHGSVSVSVKRPVGRLEVSVSLKAVS